MNKNMNIVDSLDDIFFNQDRPFFNFVYKGISKTPMHQHILEAYEHVAKLTHSQDCFPVIRCLHYDRGGYVVLPSFLNRINENHDDKNLYNGYAEYEENEYVDDVVLSPYTYVESENNSFQNWFEAYEENIDCESYKRLMTLNYLYVLPDGRILQFIYDENFLYKENATQYMFEEISSVMNKYNFKKKLDSHLQNNNIANSLNKI